MDTFYRLRTLYAIIALTTANEAFGGTICTKISDSSSADKPILANYAVTYVNGNDPWSELAHTAVEVSRTCPPVNQWNEASCYIRAEDPDNDEFYRVEHYTRTENSGIGFPIVLESGGYGYSQTFKVETCVPDDNLVWEGRENTLARTVIAYGNEMGGNWKNQGFWSFYFGAKIWSGDIPICQISVSPKDLPALISCPEYTFVQPKSRVRTDSPEEMTVREKLREKMKKLMEDARKSNEEYLQKATEYKAIWDRIKTKPFHELRSSDFGTMEGLWERVEKLNKQIEQLLVEKEVLRSEFDNSWADANIELSKISANVGVNPSDYDANFAFSIYSSSIQLQSIASDPNFNPRIYSEYAEDTIAKLKALNFADDSTNFISEAKLWLDTASELRELLQTEDLTTAEEWKALLTSFESVETYIYSVVDREFWFLDSAVSSDQRRALGHIRAWDQDLAIFIERDLRDYRERNMTTQKREILTMLEVIGDGIGDVGPESAEADEFRPLVTDLAVAIKEGAICASKVVLLGDFADLYEIVIGKDICSGEELTIGDRVVTSTGLLIGNGRFYRMLSRKAGITGNARIVAEIAADIKDKAKAMGMNDERLEALAKKLAALPRCSN